MRGASIFANCESVSSIGLLCWSLQFFFEIDGARHLQMISRTALPTAKDSLRRYVTKHQIVSVVEYRKVYQFIGKNPKDPSLEGWSRI